MKNLFKTSKRSIAAIMTLCILLGIAGTCVYAASVMPEENTVVTEETTHELVPVMARACTCAHENTRNITSGVVRICDVCGEELNVYHVICMDCGKSVGTTSDFHWWH